MSDSAQLLASQILTVIATSFAAIVIARTLDPDDWAVFSAFLGLSIALALVADFGIGTWLLRELSASSREVPSDDAPQRSADRERRVFVNIRDRGSTASWPPPPGRR